MTDAQLLADERFHWVASIDAVCVLLQHSRDEELPPTIPAINELRRVAGQIESSTQSTTTVPAVDYKALFENAVSSLAEISAALGIPEEAASTANGNEEILAALEELLHRVKTELGQSPSDELRSARATLADWGPKLTQLHARVIELEQKS